MDGAPGERRPRSLLRFATDHDHRRRDAARALVVALTAAVEEFFHYGERWRHYRRTVEWLKSEGWEYFQLGGPYRRYKTHAEAYPAFAGRVEEIIQRDIDQYVTKVVQEQTETKSDKEKQGEAKPAVP